MKGLLIFAVVAAGLSATGLTTPAVAQEREFEGVGDVIYSVLPPELFAKSHKGHWVLLDGGPLPATSPLYQFLQREGRLDLFVKENSPARLFDARGVFIRGLNLSRPAAEGDPAGSERAVGSAQPSQVGKHNHPALGYPQNARSGLAPQNRFTAPRVDAPTTPTTGEAGSDPARPQDVETRPKNIALYVYIKIGGALPR